MSDVAEHLTLNRSRDDVQICGGGRSEAATLPRCQWPRCQAQQCLGGGPDH
jgi:hypothetical protein